jgi:glycosyltransferase involved in cell wall biosynthesis
VLGLTADMGRAISVFVVGPLAPPVHGASAVTRKVVDILRTAGADVAECDTSPNIKSRGWRWHFNRLRAYGRCYRTILASKRGQCVYVSLSGGAGLFYDFIVVAIARLRAHVTIFHHHSFTYIDRWRLFFSMLVKIAPPRQVHVVLCPQMQRGITRRYACDGKFITVSNLCFLPQMSAAIDARHALRKIGFLSNLSMDKGIDRFLDLASELSSQPDVEVHFAGPFADAVTESYVRNRLKDLPNVTYHGPLFGEAKQHFYRLIDLFVFLSRYANEAEPLVLYEAMLAGLPVAITARGCACDVIDSRMAIVVDNEGQSLDPIVNRIREWRADAGAFQRASIAATERVKTLQNMQGSQIADFLAAFGLREPAPSVGGQTNIKSQISNADT